MGAPCTVCNSHLLAQFMQIGQGCISGYNDSALENFAFPALKCHVSEVLLPKVLLLEIML